MSKSALVVNRRPGQSFTIGDRIKIIVISVNGKRVKLGVEADVNVPISRDTRRGAADHRVKGSKDGQNKPEKTG